jgi:predicted house-cleaning noncanonical NTP pyrophosphatase (MazG superfamily)
VDLHPGQQEEEGGMIAKLIRINDNRDWMDDRQTLKDVHGAEALAPLLAAKLHEEAGELIAARSREQVLEELADCYEVLYTIAVMRGLTIGQVHGAASRKADYRGPLVMTSASLGPWGRVLVSQ